MSTVGNTYLTLQDVARRLDPQGKIDTIAEMLSLELPLLEDIPWVEGNLPTGHLITQRTGLPSGTWRRINQGVDPTKSATGQFTEVCGMLEAYSNVDVDMAALNGNVNAFRLSEDKAFLQGLSRQVSTALTYASAVSTPEAITGLAPRFASGPTASPTVASANQIVFGGGSSGANQTSIWLVGWSPETVFGIYPKGSKAGLDHRDLGEQRVVDANGKQFLAYITRWQWKLGLAIRDYRYIARCCNIDTTLWTSTFTSGAFSTGCDIAMKMQDLIAKLYSQNGVRPVFYMNRACYNMLNKQLVARQANWLEWITGPNGQRIPTYFGIPIKFNDSITSAESVVSA